MISKQKENNSIVGRGKICLLIIVKCFTIQTIYNLSDFRLKEEIANRKSLQKIAFTTQLLLTN